MTSQTLDTYIEIAGREFDCAVEFDFDPGCEAWGGGRWEPPTCPPEPAMVTVEKITLSPIQEPAKTQVLTDGLLFDAIANWVEQECFDRMSEDA